MDNNELVFGFCNEIVIFVPSFNFPEDEIQ